MTRAAYQNQYGIFYHSNPGAAKTRPLALVALHDKENIVEGGLEFAYIRKFYHFKIGDIFNISLDDFFNMEKYRADFLCEIGKEHIKKFEKTNSEFEKQLNMDFGNIKG